MKKVFNFILFIIFTVLPGCSTIDQNMKARKDLARCKFEFDRLELDKVNFKGAEPKSADFDLYMKITNPNEGEVVIDRADGDIYLDAAKVAHVNHKNFTRIKPGTSSKEKLDLNLPLSALAALGGKKKPVNINIDATAFVNIVIGSYTLETAIAVHIKQSFPIPYDKIKEAVDKKIAELEKKIESVDIKDKAGDLKKSIKKKLK